MTLPTCKRAIRVASPGCLIGLLLMGGCAPSRFDNAIVYYAERASVSDAAARHTTASPYYRFNTALLSDMDEALEQTDDRGQRALATAVLRDANALSLESSANEIERMPAETRESLAKLAGTEATPADLQRHLADLADAALEQDIEEVEQLPVEDLRRKLRTIREGVEDLPDDKGRSQRQAFFAWAAFLTNDGIAREESKLPEKCIAKAEKRFNRVAIWRPAEYAMDTLLQRYAPVIGVEWPDRRQYDDTDDRIGAVRLSNGRKGVEVYIDPADPTIYSYTSVAKIHGQRLQQLNYVWWFPERPEMAKGDPVAGPIDGAVLRITLDSDNEPSFIETSLNCGCAHGVFVSEKVEAAARKVFGGPLPDKRFAVERDVPGKYDVVVIDTFETGPAPGRPLVLSYAGYHEICQIKFLAPESFEIVEDASYRIEGYDSLDRLPLGNGIASMFGSDGLVHFAGRREGFLLAPSGILSAGQPRKRGTQRIRWDDYLHDDPRLLEKTLRIPTLD